MAGADVGSAVELPNERSAIPPIILDLSPRIREPLWTSLTSPGGFLFSYTAAAVLVGIGLLVGWTWKISHYEPAAEVAQHQVTSPGEPRPERQSVGRITGIADCRWGDPRTAVFNGDDVLLGGEYALAAGFVEITYDTGAKVILQGPARYGVESKSGGYLSVGRLTARVERKRSDFRVQGPEAKGERAANPIFSEHQPRVGREREPTASLAPRPLADTGGENGEGSGERGEERLNASQRAANPKSQIPNQQIFFSVRTPTAVVTDLGTEFGVQVDQSGATQSHVFRGRVEMRAAGGLGVLGPGGSEIPSGDGFVVQLGENQSARVEPTGRGTVRFVRQASRPQLFVRQITRLTPITVFNTGIGLKALNADPHWQVVARSDNPQFKPQPAVVVPARPLWPEDDPTKSQWISWVDEQFKPDYLARGNVTYTFRTTFSLTNLAPGSAVLRGRFVVDRVVSALRINGKLVSTLLPPETAQALKKEPFPTHGTFSMKKQSYFVEGTNVLEFDVYNGFVPVEGHKELSPPPPAKAGYLGLRVELGGSYVQGNSAN